MKWRRVPVVAASLALAATGLAAAAVAPSAHADEGTAANEGLNLVAAPLAGLFGPTLALPTPVCGESNVVPLQIANLTDEIQTGSVTIGGDLTENVFFVPGGTGDSACVARNGSGWYDQNGSTYTNNFTVQPQSVATLWLSMAGSTEAVGANNQFSIGGSPNGTPGQQWYDFNLYVNPDNSFSKLTTVYRDTGGTDPSTNTQGFNGTGAFNLLSCTPQSVSAPTSILTPYESGAAANGPTYYAGNPLCMGWVPAGETIPAYNTSSVTASGPLAPVTVNAAQYNETLGTVSAVIGVPGGFSLVTSVQAIDANGAQVYLPTSPSSTGWYSTSGFTDASDAAGDVAIVESIPAYANTQLLVTVQNADNVSSTSLVTLNTGAPNVAPTIATDDSPSQVQNDPVDPLTPPTPVTSDYSVSILDADNPTLSSGQPSGTITPGVQIVSVGDTSMSLQVGISTDGNANIPNYPGGGATLTSVTMPDGTSQSYNIPVSMDGEVYTTVNLPLLNVKTNQMYTGEFDFTLNFTYSNGSGFYFGVQVEASPPTEASATPQPTIEGPTYQDYSMSFSNPSWATLSGAPTEVNGPNLEVLVDVTPVASVLAEMQEYVGAGGEEDGGAPALTLQTLTMPSGVNRTIGAMVDVTDLTATAIPYTVDLPIADAAGNYYTGTFSYVLTFAYGNGTTSQATVTVTANPPSSS